jgi:hypothetical protein
MVDALRDKVHTNPSTAPCAGASADSLNCVGEHQLAGAQWLLTPPPDCNDLLLRARISDAARWALRAGYRARHNQGDGYPVMPEVAAHVETAGDSIVLAVTDGQQTTGVHLMPLDRRQAALTLGGHGILHADRWKNEEVYCGPIVIVPGAGNTIAAVNLRVPVLGVTNPSDIPTFSAILARMLADCDPHQFICFVASRAWASRAARALDSALPGRLVRWALPPHGHSSTQSWADARLAVMTDDETLADLGALFCDSLVVQAPAEAAADDEPDCVLEDADLASLDPPGMDPDGAGVKALLPPVPIVEDPAPEFRPYLSLVALARAEFPTDAEIRLAHRAHIAAVKGRHDEVARLVAEGDALSRAIGDGERAVQDSGKIKAALDEAEKALADAPESERTRLRRECERLRATREEAVEAVLAARLVLGIRSGWRPERLNPASGGVMAIARPAAVVRPATIGQPATPGQNVKAHNAQTASPAAPNDDWAKITLDLLKIRVLGEHSDQSIEIYSGGRRKTATIPNIRHLNYRDLYQIAGPLARLYVHPGKDQVENKVSMEDVALVIAHEAGKRSLEETPPWGQGCWKLKKGDGGVLIVNGRQAAVYRPGKALRQTCKPFAGGHVLEFRSSRRWYRFGRLRKYIELAGDPAWATAVFAEAIRMFGQWRWGALDDARVAAALVPCTVVQHCWRWRPQIGLTGATNSGKSTLLETLNLLFGALALHTEKATEAGLRQTVGNRSCAVIIDEFEADGQRVQVLKLLRTSARGANIVRGTSDQKGKQFGLKHIAWVAAIELGLKNDTDRNRFIILETLRPDDDKFGTMNLPTDDAVADLGQKLAAIGIRHVLGADPLAVKLKTTRVPGVPTRVIESFAVPAAMVATACGLDEEAARKILREMLEGRSFSGRAQSDHDGLLRAIMNSLVVVRTGVQHPVSQILTSPQVFADAHATLTKMGVAGATAKLGRRPDTPEGCTHLFIDPDAACRHLLRGTDWAEKDVKELLLRIEHVGDDGQVQKAAWLQRRLNGARPWGVLIPLGAAGIMPASDDDESEDELPDTEGLEPEVPLPADMADQPGKSEAVKPMNAPEPGKSLMDEL